MGTSLRSFKEEEKKKRRRFRSSSIQVRRVYVGQEMNLAEGRVVQQPRRRL